jgi:transposase
MELWERAVRMVVEVRPNCETEWAAIAAVAAKLGGGSSETVRKRVLRAEIDGVSGRA